MSSTAIRIRLEIATNTLRLTLDPPLPLEGRHSALLDLTTRGRMLGIELGDHYVTLADGDLSPAIPLRTAEIAVDIQNGGGELVVPRRGDGWEISYPIGNRCWRTAADGSMICELTSAAAQD